MSYPPSWLCFRGASPLPPQQHLPWVAEVTRTAVMQRLHSTAARRAMVATGRVFEALSGLCGGPRATLPGGRHSLAHQPGGNREGEARAVPQKAQKEGCLGHSLLLVAKGIHPAAPRGAGPDPAPPVTEATPSSQRLPTPGPLAHTACPPPPQQTDPPVWAPRNLLEAPSVF